MVKLVAPDTFNDVRPGREKPYRLREVITVFPDKFSDFNFLKLAKPVKSEICSRDKSSVVTERMFPVGTWASRAPVS